MNVRDRSIKGVEGRTRESARTRCTLSKVKSARGAKRGRQGGFALLEVEFEPVLSYVVT